MKRYYSVALLTAVALAAAILAAPASAQLTPEPGAQYAGHASVNLANGVKSFTTGPLATAVAGDVYSNIGSAPNFGYSALDLAAIWGDRVTTIGGGLLDQNDFTVYNSNTSAGPLLTSQFVISLYDGSTLAGLGSYLTGVVSFGTGLTPGYYSVITVTGLAGLAINLPTTDILITQQMYLPTGTANRSGFVSLNPPTIGTSTSSLYINSVAVGPAGFYTIGTNVANPGYRINVNNATPTNTTTWGQLKALYR